jgi:hypothetical protein
MLQFVLIWRARAAEAGGEGILSRYAEIDMSILGTFAVPADSRAHFVVRLAQVRHQTPDLPMRSACFIRNLWGTPRSAFCLRLAAKGTFLHH